MKVKLLQLTSSKAKVLGYVNLPVFVETIHGELLQLDVEAYVVSNMSVPILLGEDLHEAYNLTVSRDEEVGTTVQFGKSHHILRASGVERTSDHALAVWKKDKGTEKYRKFSAHRRARKDPIKLCVERNSRRALEFYERRRIPVS